MRSVWIDDSLPPGLDQLLEDWEELKIGGPIRHLIGRYRTLESDPHPKKAEVVAAIERSSKALSVAVQALENLKKTESAAMGHLCYLAGQYGEKSQVMTNLRTLSRAATATAEYFEVSLPRQQSANTARDWLLCEIDALLAGKSLPLESRHEFAIEVWTALGNGEISLSTYSKAIQRFR